MHPQLSVVVCTEIMVAMLEWDNKTVHFKILHEQLRITFQFYSVLIVKGLFLE